MFSVRTAILTQGQGHGTDTASGQVAHPGAWLLAPPEAPSGAPCWKPGVLVSVPGGRGRTSNPCPCGGAGGGGVVQARAGHRAAAPLQQAGEGGRPSGGAGGPQGLSSLAGWGLLSDTKKAEVLRSPQPGACGQEGAALYQQRRSAGRPGRSGRCQLLCRAPGGPASGRVCPSGQRPRPGPPARELRGPAVGSGCARRGLLPSPLLSCPAPSSCLCGGDPVPAPHTIIPGTQKCQNRTFGPSHSGEKQGSCLRWPPGPRQRAARGQFGFPPGQSSLVSPPWGRGPPVKAASALHLGQSSAAGLVPQVYPANPQLTSNALGHKVQSASG